MKLLHTLAYFLIPISYFLIPPAVHAGAYALGISPAILEHIAYPVNTISTQVIIANNTHFPLPIKGSIRPFLATEKIEEPLASRYDASQWIELEPADFILQPGERKAISVFITAPEDAEPGGHYATIIFEPLIPREALAYDSTISLARISSLVLLSVPGEIQPSLRIEGWTLPKTQTFGPVTTNLTIANDGNIHLVPTVTIDLYNIWGRKLDSQTTDNVTILPGTERSINFESKQHSWFGPHYLQAEVSYGSDKIIIKSRSPTVWFIPWPYLCVILIILTLSLKLFIVGRKRLKLAWRILTTAQPREDL